MLILPLWTQCKCRVIVKILEFIVLFKRCSLKLFWEAIRVYVSLSICVSPRKICQIKFLNVLKNSWNGNYHIGLFIPIKFVSCSETVIAKYYMNFRSKSHINSLQNIDFINTAKSVKINLSIRSLHYSLAYSFIALLFSNHWKKAKTSIYWMTHRSHHHLDKK